MTEVFISHCPKDKLTAENICSFLTKRGFVCMTSGGFMGMNSHGKSPIVEALSTMKVFILIYSSGSAYSARVSGQLELALNKAGTVVIPYRIDNAPITGKLARFLMVPNRIDAYPANNDLSLEQLYTTVSWIMSGGAGNMPYVPNKAGDFVPFGAYIPRPVKDNTPIRLLAACAAVFAGGVIATTAVHYIKEKLHNEPVSEPVSAVETVPEKIRETATFSCKVMYLGSLYEGEYTGEVGDNGMPDGSGEFKSCCSEESELRSLEYTGEFLNGAITGKGKSKFETANGDSYEYDGYLENGVMKGRGVCDHIFGEQDNIKKETYEGLWYSNKDISDYKETEYCTDGSVRVYIGELKDHQWEGKGFLKCTFTSGDIKEKYFQGTWKDGELEGQVMEIAEYNNGDHLEYTGEYTKDNWNGEGVKKYYYASGDIKDITHEGTYTDGELSGTVTKTVNYKNGEVWQCTGDYSDYAFNGQAVQTYKYSSGKVRQVKYEGGMKDGKRHGEGVMTKYYNSSAEKDAVETKIYEGEWSEGVLSGNIICTETLKNGNVKVYKGGYSNDERNGSGVLTITYGKSEKDKKKKIVEGNWESGSLNGEVEKTVYYKNGDIEEYSGGYSDSDKNGEGTFTYTDRSTGEKRVEEGRFSEDSLTEGTKTYYDKKGNITKTEIYKNGTAVETEFAEEKEKSS